MLSNMFRRSAKLSRTLTRLASRTGPQSAAASVNTLSFSTTTEEKSCEEEIADNVIKVVKVGLAVYGSPHASKLFSILEPGVGKAFRACMENFNLTKVPKKGYDYAIEMKDFEQLPWPGWEIKGADETIMDKMPRSVLIAMQGRFSTGKTYILWQLQTIEERKKGVTTRPCHFSGP